MDSKKFIRIYKIAKIAVLILFILICATLAFLETDVFTMFFENEEFKGIGFWWTMLFVVVATVLYIVWHIFMQGRIANILKEKCAPKEYREVYKALSPKNNKIGECIVDITTDFMLGNFDAAKARCFEVLQTEVNISLRHNAYSVLSQIFLLTEDVDNLEQLKQSASIGTIHEKYGNIYDQIVRTASAFIEFLKGRTDHMVEAYSMAREICKSNCDLYLSLYYYAISLVKAGDFEKAIPVFEEIILNGNELFTVKFSKIALLAIVSEK